MKILVLSDSHSSLRLMRMSIDRIRPDTVIHLGDYYGDAQAVAEEYPHLVFHQVPGNCDNYHCSPFIPRILNYDVGGVRLYMTHGHKHNVKFDLSLLLQDARKARVAAGLYGHTHIPDCRQEPDGLWILNPGSCGHAGGSAGVIETDHGRIQACYLVGAEDLAEMKN